MFVVAAAQSGRHEDGRETYGHSLVVGPWGEVLLDMGEGRASASPRSTSPQIEAVRARLPALSHRRPIPPPERGLMIIFDLRCDSQGHVFEAWFGFVRGL